MGMIYGGQDYIFSKNLQGDVIGIYNSSRQLVAKYTYNAYGEITAITNASGTDISNNATHIANINPFRYRGYYYDTETGFYYLQSRYYDPVVGRFLNADAFVSTGQGILGNNMFAYCLNNPVIYADYKGFSVASVLDETIRMSAVSAGWGGVSAALGGLSPIGGIVGTIIVVAFLSSNGISYNSSFDDNDIVSGECRSVFSSDYEYYPDYYGVYTAPTSRATSKAVAKEEEKDVALPYTPPALTVIYRYGGTNPGNLTPKAKDKYSGLSFSTKPMPGSAKTTIEALNATGVVFAFKYGATHVSARPVGATMEDWIKAGPSSKWTQAIKSVVIK